MIKAIFFDIDGTLYNDQSKVSPSTKKAIALAQAKGIICGVATGRGPSQLRDQIKALDLDIFVTYNGQFIYNKEAVIYSKPFSKKVINDIVSFSEEHNRQVTFGSSTTMAGSSLLRFGQRKWMRRLGKLLPNRLRRTVLKRMEKQGIHHKKKFNYQQLPILKERVYQCVMLSDQSELATLQNQFPDCDFTRSNPYTVDILPLGGSKFAGIKVFATRYGLSLDEVMAFGDNLNDIEMLEGVGIGIAMGNGEEKIKRIAKFVSKSNNEDGIYHALKMYNII